MRSGESKSSIAQCSSWYSLEGQLEHPKLVSGLKDRMKVVLFLPHIPLMTVVSVLVVVVNVMPPV